MEFKGTKGKWGTFNDRADAIGQLIEQFKNK